LFLEIDFTHEPCQCLKQIFLEARTILSDSLLLIRDDFFKKKYSRVAAGEVEYCTPRGSHAWLCGWRETGVRGQRGQ